MTRGGRPERTVSCPCRSKVIGNRPSARRPPTARLLTATLSQLWVATDRPAAWPAARRKYCILRNRVGPRCRPARSST
eukprot:2340960-Lingulodinium_polyedra.AAC.1